MKRISKLFIARLLACLILGCLALPASAATIEHDFGDLTEGPGGSAAYDVSVSNDPNITYIYFRTTRAMEFRYYIESTDEYTCKYCVSERYEGEREYPTRAFANSSLCFNYLPEGEYRVEITTSSKKAQTKTYTISVAVGVNHIPEGNEVDIPIGFPYISESKQEWEPNYGKVTSSGLTATRSYVRKITPLTANGLSALETIAYFDGLGRPVQTVQKGITPSKADLVDFTDYNSRGLPWRNWNAIPITGLNGAFISDQPIRAKELLNDTRPCTEILYDPYGIDIPVKQVGAGEKFSGHATLSKLHVNTVSGLYSCNRYSIRNDELISNGVHPAGILSITEATDEDGRKSMVFKDRMKRTIAEKQIDGKSDYSTYYVYTSGGDLGYVLPPALEGSADTTVLSKFAYAYKYDGLHRVIEKKLPGCEPIHYYYDLADRAVFTQDGNQYTKGEYSFTLYNLQGQVAVTGLCKCDNPNIFETSLAYAVQVKNDGYCNSGYTFPLMHSATDIRLSQVNYYDTYDYLDVPYITSYKTALSYLYKEGYGVRYVNNECSLASANGRLTGSRTFTTDGSNEIITSFYYDDRGNLVQSSIKNHLGACEHKYMCYTFSNQISSYLHISDSLVNKVETYFYTYDHAGRLIRVSHRLDSNPLVTLCENEYDEFGRLKARSIHDKMNRSEYSYNLRNWLTKTTNPLFSQALYYTDGMGTPQYGGNISSMTWKAGETARGYKFMYDGFNRMTTAIYGEGDLLTINPNRFNEEVLGYDKNGNILGLKRSGQTSENDYGLIDSLFLSYNGNQLKSINDDIVGSTYNNGFEFRDGAKQSTEYFYDANGNLTKDLNKKITDIQYNYLNLPAQIMFEDGSVIFYLYDATGTKLRVVHSTTGNVTTTDYCGNVIYENGIAKLLLTEAGFISLSDCKYHYYLQDHLGNNRVVIDQNGEVEEVNHYYPFGGVFANSTSVQSYKYNGKEFNDFHGFNWYDYGARWYDPALGRWHSVDPSFEKYYCWSPYAYCVNNPIKFIDPNGKDIRLYNITHQDNRGRNIYQSGLSFKTENVMRDLIKIPEMLNLFGQFAKAGDVVGGHMFLKDGQLSNCNLDLMDYSYGKELQMEYLLAMEVTQFMKMSLEK